MAAQKIAILGGGVGSLATAWYLTRTSELRARYDVTVYQMGWRLGGKGASGRNLDPDKGFRIEEHGLHIWLGFYDNAFATIQDVYAELVAEGLAPDSPIRSWQDAFAAQSFTPVGLGDGETWLPVTWPTNDRTPGAEGPPHPLRALTGAIELLLHAIRATWGRNPLRWACILWRALRIRLATSRAMTPPRLQPTRLTFCPLSSYTASTRSISFSPCGPIALGPRLRPRSQVCAT